MEQKDVGDATCNWCTRNDLQKLVNRAGRDGNQKTSRNHTVLIGQITEKSPGILKRLDVTQTPVKDP